MLENNVPDEDANLEEKGKHVEFLVNWNIHSILYFHALLQVKQMAKQFQMNFQCTMKLLKLMLALINRSKHRAVGFFVCQLNLLLCYH